MQCHSIIQSRNTKSVTLEPTAKIDSPKKITNTVVPFPQQPLIQQPIEERKKIELSKEEEPEKGKALAIMGAKRKLSSIFANPAASQKRFALIQEDPTKRYQIETEVCTSENSIVFLVSSTTDSYKYIMKRILPANDEEKSLIIEEIGMHQQAFHANILKYYAAYYHEGYI